MKKKLSIAGVFIAIITCITLIIYTFIQKENDVNVGKDIEEKENIIQEYHGTDDTYQRLDYPSEKGFECYDMSGKLIKNPEHEQWNTLNCYLYHENGQMMFKASSTKENLEGEVRVKSILSYYYENGNIESETTYINGEKIGVDVVYYENGQIKAKGDNIDGQKNGTRIYLYENGQIMGYGKYLNGEQNGKRISFYENGQKEQELYFTNGLASGEFIKYYENGNMSQKGNFKDGKLEGNAIAYYENGKILQEATFKNGELVEEKFYDKNGELMN